MAHLLTNNYLQSANSVCSLIFWINNLSYCIKTISLIISEHEIVLKQINQQYKEAVDLFVTRIKPTELRDKPEEFKLSSLIKKFSSLEVALEIDQRLSA